MGKPKTDVNNDGLFVCAAIRDTIVRVDDKQTTPRNVFKIKGDNCVIPGLKKKNINPNEQIEIHAKKNTLKITLESI